MRQPLGLLVMMAALGAMAMVSDPQPAKPVRPAVTGTPAAGEEELPAALRGKYGALLKKIAVPQDLQGYGEVRVYGWWSGTAYVGYQDLPPGYWVYSYPDWYIFDGPPGMVSPYVSKEERALFSECRGKEKVPDALIKAWAKFAKAAKEGDPKTLQAMCLPLALAVTENDSLAHPPAVPLNVSLLKMRFDARVFLVSQESDSSMLVRTAPMAFWFVETAKEGWKLYRFVNKDIQ